MRDTLKLILKTVALTLATIFASVAIILLLLSFSAPAAMAKFTGDIGLYNQSAFYDSLAYADGGGKIEYIAEAVNYSARTENYKKVIRYGTAFIEDERFEAYCREQEEWEKENYGEISESYDQYVYGLICVAYYYEGQNQEALELALSVNQTGFDRYNAATDLIREVIISTGNTGDKTFAKEILNELKALRDGGAIAETAALDEMISTLTQYTNK